MASTRKPTTSCEGNPCSGSEYRIDVGHNHGQLIAGHNNTIYTHNVFEVLMVESSQNKQNNNKKRATKRIKRKNKRPESVESDRSERSKNSEPGKGKKFTKNSPRKEKVLNESQSGKESNTKQADNSSLKELLKLSDQDFVTASEDESPSPDPASNKHLFTTDDAEMPSTLRYRPQNKEDSSKENIGISESESKFAYRPKNNTQSADSFSPFKVALRQAICFAACIIFCLYFEALSFLPFLFWLIFVANNLLACFSCIKFTFKTIDCREIPTYEAHNGRPFVAIARLQVDFFIKEEDILQRLFALLLCVSLAFVSSQIFGCATCLLMQTIVVSVISTIPYLLFKNNILLPFPLAEHCRVFNEGLESSGNILC